MLRSRFLLVAAAAAALLALGCGDPIKQPYAAPDAGAFVTHLRQVGDRAKTYVATENTMDYWLGKQRIKTTMHVMGEKGAKVRFNGINPQTDMTAADLACDGSNFSFQDFEHNCQLSGVCDRQAIAQLLRVSMEPDDFLLLAVGSAPIIPDPTGKVTWNGKNGTWQVDLTSPSGQKQRLVLDGNDGDGGKWEVLESTVWDSAGKVEWKLSNKKMKTVKSEDGVPFRLPTYSKFVQPQQKADLVVEWATRKINLPPQPADKYQVAQVSGLRVCGQKTGPAPAASPAPAQPTTGSAPPATDTTKPPATDTTKPPATGAAKPPATGAGKPPAKP
jgi:hypothetical protein